MLLLQILFVSVGVLLIALSIPLIRGKIPPNGLYGFRTPRTMSDPGIWYPANTYAAWRLLWVGIVIAIAALTVCLIPGLKVDVYAYIIAGVAGIGLIVTLIQSFLFLGKLPRQDD